MSIAASLFVVGALAGCSSASSAADDSTSDPSALASAPSSSSSASTPALSGSFRSDDPTSAIRGIVVKDPTRNYQFEKGTIAMIDVEPTLFPGLCPAVLPHGAICSDSRVTVTAAIHGSTLTLAPETSAGAISPLLQPLMGDYSFSLTASGLTLSRSAPTAVSYALSKASYCTSEYDCNIVTPDSMCNVGYRCSAQNACSVKSSDPACDVTYRSVQDLSHVGGTWVATGPTAGDAPFSSIVLTPTSNEDDSSKGTFVATPTGAPGQPISGPFRADPENAAIGVASITLSPGSSNQDVLTVSGVKLDAQNKIVSMKVTTFPVAVAGSNPRTPWQYDLAP